MADRIPMDSQSHTRMDASMATPNTECTHSDVLALIADVERSLTRLREQAGDEAARAKDADQLETQVEALTAEKAALLASAAEANARERALEAQSAALQSHATALEWNNADLESNVATLETQAAALESKAAALETQAAVFELKAAAFESKAAGLETKTAELETKAAALESKAAALESKAAAHESNATALSSRAEASETKAAAFESMTTVLESHASALESKVAALEANTVALESNTAALESKTAALESKAAALESKAASFECTAAELAEQTAALESERAALQSDATAREANLSVLRDERATFLGRQIQLESQLAAARAQSAHHESNARRASEEYSRFESEASQLQDSLHSQFATALEERAAMADTAGRALSAKIGTLERENARIEQLERENAKIEALERELEVAQQAARDAAIATTHASTLAPTLEPIDETEIARAAEARIQRLVVPKLAQLAQAAAFLRTRKTRLAAVREGLRLRAKAQRALRQIYSAPPLDGSATSREPAAFAGEMQSERLHLVAERQELVELRDILAASEERLARRARSSRFFTTTAFVALFLSATGAISWHFAAVLAPPSVLATVELEVARRADGTEATTEVDSSAVAAWLRESLSNDTFIGAVSGRLSDRGRLRAESEALVAGMSERASVEADGSVVRVSLRGDGTDTTVATLDAIATTAYVEGNRLPERRSDHLKLGIANASREVGRTVFSHAETITDASQRTRAAMLWGALTAAGALLAGAFWVLARRAGRSDSL